MHNAAPAEYARYAALSIALGLKFPQPSLIVQHIRQQSMLQI